MIVYSGGRGERRNGFLNELENWTLLSAVTLTEHIYFMQTSSELYTKPICNLFSIKNTHFSAYLDETVLLKCADVGRTQTKLKPSVTFDSQLVVWKQDQILMVF